MGFSTFVSSFFGLKNDPKKKPEEEYSISTANISQDLIYTNIDYDQTSDLNESTIRSIFSEEITLDASSEFEDDINNQVTLAKRNLSRSSSSTSGPDRKLTKFYHPRSSFLENKERFERIINNSKSCASLRREECQQLIQELCEDYTKTSRSDATGWKILISPKDKQYPIIPKSKANSDYKNTRVDLQFLKKWQNFPTFEEIKLFIRNNNKLRSIFFDALLPNGGNEPWYQVLFRDPAHFPALEETSVVMNYCPFFAQLASLIRLACQGVPEIPDCRGLLKLKWVMIGSGKCAMKRRSEGTPDMKNPDLVAFWTDGNHNSSLNFEKNKALHGKNVDCLIVGDFKMATKFHSKMLEAHKNRGGKIGPEPTKVINQIHDYMDMHHNRFGYIITHNELIMFRRRNSEWGHLDYSDPIPVDTIPGHLNAMMVLWYFHVKYAVMNLDGGWKLRSAYHKLDKKKDTWLLGKSVCSI